MSHPCQQSPASRIRPLIFELWDFWISNLTHQWLCPRLCEGDDDNTNLKGLLGMKWAMPVKCLTVGLTHSGRSVVQLLVSHVCG